MNRHPDYWFLNKISTYRVKFGYTIFSSGRRADLQCVFSSVTVNIRHCVMIVMAALSPVSFKQTHPLGARRRDYWVRALPIPLCVIPLLPFSRCGNARGRIREHKHVRAFGKRVLSCTRVTLYKWCKNKAQNSKRCGSKAIVLEIFLSLVCNGS